MTDENTRNNDDDAPTRTQTILQMILARSIFDRVETILREGGYPPRTAAAVQAIGAFVLEAVWHFVHALEEPGEGPELPAIAKFMDTTAVVAVGKVLGAPPLKARAGN